MSKKALVPLGIGLGAGLTGGASLLPSLAGTAGAGAAGLGGLGAALPSAAGFAGLGGAGAALGGTAAGLGGLGAALPTTFGASLLAPAAAGTAGLAGLEAALPTAGSFAGLGGAGAGAGFKGLLGKFGPDALKAFGTQEEPVPQQVGQKPPQGDPGPPSADLISALYGDPEMLKKLYASYYGRA